MDNRPVVFLGIDGVIATASSYRLANSKLKDQQVLNIPAVERLNRFVNFLDARVIICSPWRLIHPVEWFQQHVSPAVEGVTGTHHSGLLWMEVDAYADQAQISIDRFVVLENNQDLENLRSRWVKTSFDGGSQGFQRKHVRKCLQLFGMDGADQLSRSIG